MTEVIQYNNNVRGSQTKDDLFASDKANLNMYLNRKGH